MSPFRSAAVILFAFWIENQFAAGAQIAVPAGGDLQAALNSAKPGDTIVLEAGAIYTGNFLLPKKNPPPPDSREGIADLRQAQPYVTITSSKLSALPPAGTRVAPSDAANMPAIVSPNGAAALATAHGAHHYRLLGLEIRPASGVYGFELISLGDDAATTIPAQAHDFDVDRVYIHGDPVQGAKRGIGLNSASTTIENSYVSDIKSTIQDSQALCGWSGPGPFTIVNNYLEAAGENVMFGGSAPSIPNLTPSGITIRGNYFFKPLSWKKGDPSYAGTEWSVKNLFEIKNAQNVMVDGNVFENNWGQSQVGFAIQLTARFQGGLSAFVQNVTFQNNIVRHTGGAVNILGKDDLNGNQGQAGNLVFRNNLFVDVDAVKWLGNGYLFQILNGAAGIIIEHNTAFPSASLIVADLLPTTGFVFQNNISPLLSYGVFGSGEGSGVAALDYYFPGWIFSGNVLPGYANGQPGYPLHPTGNYYPAGLSDVGFVDAASGDYRLSSNSPYIGKGTDGTNPGIDQDALQQAAAAAIPATMAARIQQRRGK